MLCVALRLRFLDVPLSVDEGGYAYVARFWARGFQLYRDVWVDRPQGLLLLFRGTEALLGPHGWAVRLLATVFAAASVSLLGVLGLRLSGAVAGLAAAGLYALLSVGPSIEGFAANGELLATLPSLAALVVFAGWLRGRGGRGALVAAGALAGCAVLVKQSGYDGGATIALWLALAAWRGWRPRGVALRALGLVVLGAGLLLAAAALHGALIGIGNWWFAVAGYRLGVESVATGSASQRLQLLWESLGSAWPTLLPLVVLAAAGLPAVRRSPRLVLLALWPLVSLTGFALGGLFHPHYYVGLVAPLCALAGLGVEQLLRHVAARRLAPALALLLAVPVVAAVPAYTADGPAAVSWRTTHDTRVLADAAVARWLDARTTPAQTVYALYADASLYFAADRRSAFRYLWYLGVQHIPGALAELQRTLAGPHAPRFVAVYQPPGSIDRSGRIAEILRTRYRQRAIVSGIPLYERRP